MGIEELPPICRTPRLEELEADGQAMTAELLRSANLPLGSGARNGSSDDDFQPVSARSAPEDSQSIMRDMVELPFQDSRQDALHPGTMTPGAQKIAAAAAQSETPASRRLKFNSNFGGSVMDTSVMEGLDGALYLSPDGNGVGRGTGPSSSQRSHEPQIVLEMEESEFVSMSEAAGQHMSDTGGGYGGGPTSTAMSRMPAPSHADERGGHMYSSQHRLPPDSDFSPHGAEMLGQRATETHFDDAKQRERQPQPQHTMQTEFHLGPSNTDTSSPSDSGRGVGYEAGFNFPRNPYTSMERTSSKQQKLHTAPAAPEQESFAGKATEQWQSTRPGRGRDTNAARRAQMAGDTGVKPGGVRKMLRSASDACKRLAEAATASSREAQRQRSRSQAPSPSVAAPTRTRRITQTGNSTVKTTTNTVGVGRLNTARGAATMGNVGSKVPGSVEIRMQQRAMHQFGKANARTGRTTTARELAPDKDSDAGNIRGRGNLSARASSTAVPRRGSSVQARPVRLPPCICISSAQIQCLLPMHDVLVLVHPSVTLFLGQDKTQFGCCHAHRNALQLNVYE
jgi:hypothetical protein